MRKSGAAMKKLREEAYNEFFFKKIGVSCRSHKEAKDANSKYFTRGS